MNFVISRPNMTPTSKRFILCVSKILKQRSFLFNLLHQRNSFSGSSSSLPGWKILYTNVINTISLLLISSYFETNFQEILIIYFCSKFLQKKEIAQTFQENRSSVHHDFLFWILLHDSCLFDGLGDLFKRRDLFNT